MLAMRQMEIPSSRVSEPVSQTAAPAINLRGATVLLHDSLAPRGQDASLGSLQKDQLALSRAQHRLQVGIYVDNNYGLDFDIPAYSSSGRLWLIWQQPLQSLLESSGMNVEDLLVILNRIDGPSRGSLKSTSTAPIKLSGDRYLQSFSFDGKFKIDRVQLQFYPFNSLGLPLIIEAADPLGKLHFSNFRLLPDVKDSGMGQLKEISGWINEGWSFAEYRHRMLSGFGLNPRESSSEQSQVVFESVYRTSTWAAFWELLQPVGVVLGMTILISKIDRQVWELRAGAPLTILLTLVFLQQGYKDSLPPLPYLTFLDKVYVMAYLMSFLSFVFALWSCRRESSLQLLPDGKERLREQQRLDRLDLIFPVLLIISGSVAVVASWVWR